MSDVLSYNPKPDCSACRLGTLTVPCSEDDVRRIQSSALLPDGEKAGFIPDPVRLYRTGVVLGEGPVPCPIALVGEAPGYHEDREGKPFRPHAPAGRVLQQALTEVGLCRLDWVEALGAYDQCVTHVFPHPDNFYPAYITNVVKCRPLDNKLDKFPDAVEVCRERFLLPELAAVRPKVIVALGVTAATHWLGAVRNASRVLADGTTVIYSPHPSSIARGNAPGRERLLYALRQAKEIAYS